MPNIAEYICKSTRLVLSILFIVVAGGVVSAQTYTIHLLDPWDSEYNGLQIMIRGGVGNFGYYPGMEMTPEGAGWYQIQVTVTGPQDYRGFWFVSYSTNTTHELLGPEGFIPVPGDLSDATGFNFDQVFLDCDTTEIWIIPNGNIPPAVLCNHPDSKVLYIFNPWPVSAPEIRVGAAGGAYEEMKLAKDVLGNAFCGWMAYYFHNISDYTVHFREIIGHASVYGAAGLGSTEPIDLNALYKTYNALYILPTL